MFKFVLSLHLVGLWQDPGNVESEAAVKTTTEEAGNALEGEPTDITSHHQ